MTVACYLEPTKLKSSHWVRAFAAGCNGKIVTSGRRDRKCDDHVVFGNWPVATDLITDFKATETGFWYCDSAYIHDLCETRYLRVERNRFWPGAMRGDHKINRALSMGAHVRPWRYTGTHVLIAQHGPKFGIPWGIDILEWNVSIEARVRAMTDRPIIVRPKLVTPVCPLEEHFKDAWCVVAHSSTVAVRAALLGIPVFVEPTNAAALVGRTDLDIERPVRPPREQWIAALAWRQWSEQEMKSGEAWNYLRQLQ